MKLLEGFDQSPPTMKVRPMKRCRICLHILDRGIKTKFFEVRYACKKHKFCFGIGDEFQFSDPNDFYCEDYEPRY